jgi:hypothetical protein
LEARKREIEDIGRNATQAEKQEWADIMNKLNPDYRDIEGNQTYRGMPSFKSTHWDEDDVLAHARLDDRVDAAGDNISFSNEYQSDWQAKGREHGFGMRTTTVDKSRDPNWDYEITDVNTGEVLDHHNGSSSSAMAKARQISESGVPDQPFKSTNDMIDFMLKRHADLALREGKDGFGWGMGLDIGESQNKFIRKNLDEVRVTSGGNEADYRITGFKNGEPVTDRTASAENLGDYIGKDKAQEVLGKKGETFPREGYKWKGKDLEIGSQGNKAFYDQMVVNRANKLFKKHGMKAELATMPDGRQYWKVKFTDDFKGQVEKKGQPLFSAAPLVPAAGLARGEEKQQSELERLGFK